MNEPKSAENQPQLSREEMSSALFANMVVQQTNMALMFLGQVPHPETGQPVRDLETARMFIDTLDMLEVKTKGNLNKHEETLLKRNLTSLRMAFVEAINQEPTSSEPQKSAPTEASPEAPAAPEARAEEGAAAASPTEEPESRKKYSKKY